MGRRGDGDGPALGGEAGVAAGGEHVREPRGVDRAQIEPYVVRAVRVDALEDRGGELIARSELVGEPSPGGVEQRRALPAERLGEQCAVVG